MKAVGARAGPSAFRFGVHPGWHTETVSVLAVLFEKVVI